MKKITLSYHRDFQWAPISGRAGARKYGWKNLRTETGQWKSPKTVRHPFAKQRKLWCVMVVEFQDIELIFAMPPELDQFLDVMSQNPLPSGHRLVKGQKLGSPNGHWLSRLPKKAKSWAFRQKICRFLETDPRVQKFRDFYMSQPVQLEFEGYFDSYHDAKRAQNSCGG